MHPAMLQHQGDVVVSVVHFFWMGQFVWEWFLEGVFVSEDSK